MLSAQYDHRSPEGRLIKSSDGDEGGNAVPPGEHTPGKKATAKSPNLEGFNETAYILGSPKNQDTYRLNAFNQAESDKLNSARMIPDTRNYK